MSKHRGNFVALKVLVSMMAIAWLSPVFATDLGVATNEVRCTEIAFSQSVETRDSVSFASFLDEDARFVGASVLRGDSQVVKAWAPFFEENGPQLVWRPYVVEVAKSGDIALSRGPYRMRTLDEKGQVIESWGIYNSVWRESADGHWKIIFDAGNPSEKQVNEAMKALIEAPVEHCSPVG